MESIVSPVLEDADVGALGDTPLGGGAQFFVYISAQNDGLRRLVNWSVEFIQGKWSGKITSGDPRGTILKTPNLSGTFTVKVRGEVAPEIVIADLRPKPPSTDKIGCNSNCRSFVGIVVDPVRPEATYWTTWDAICTPSG